MNTMKKEVGFLFPDEKVRYKLEAARRTIVAGKIGNASLKNGLLFHGSAVLIDNGGAIVFIGHSTAGKSTISNKLISVFEKIEDDQVLLIENSKSKFFLRKKGLDGTIREYPLISIFQVIKSNLLTVEQVSPKYLCKKMLDAYFEIDSQRYGICRENNRTIFFEICRLAKQITGWKIYFSLDSDLGAFFTGNLMQKLEER